MHFKAVLVAGLLQTATAYPQIKNNFVERAVKTPPIEDGGFGPFPYYPGKPTHALFDQFDADEQLVSTSGKHRYIKPRKSDIRGPCAGLNAAANNGYLRRDGIATGPDILTGLQQAYGVATDLLTFLQTATMFFDGDPITGFWSIGPESPKTYALGGISQALGTETGICEYGHLKTEGDGSITRGDWLAPKNNDNCLSYPKFMGELLSLADQYGGGRLTPQILAYHQYQRKQYSVKTNPNYFNPPYAGVAFTFGAHMFAWELLANHSASEPKGFLTKDVFKSFFGYTGGKNGRPLKYNLGQERIPDNWYRRSLNDQWDLADVGASTAQQCVSYPSNCQVGGNTGEVNSFDGVDPGDISGGFLNSFEDFQDPNRFLCFLAQNLQAEVPSFLDKTFSGAAYNTAIRLMNKQLPLALAPFGKCDGLPKGKSILQYNKKKYPGLNFDAPRKRFE